jgi:DNA repair protein RadC
MRSIYEYSIARKRSPNFQVKQDPIRGPYNAVKITREIIGEIEQEVFLVLLLDIKNKVKGYVEVARGGIDSCQVDPRVVFRAAVMCGCVGIIVAHNHPSGDPNPSDEDIAITKRLKQGGELLGIAVLDHVIVTPDDWESFAEKGIMP